MLWFHIDDPIDVVAIHSKLYNHYNVFPELYGSCSGIYMEEWIKSLPSTSFIQPVSFTNWVERARVALTLMNLLKELHTMFEHPPRICVAKLEHFGLLEVLQSKMCQSCTIIVNDIKQVFLQCQDMGMEVQGELLSCMVKDYNVKVEALKQMVATRIEDIGFINRRINTMDFKDWDMSCHFLKTGRRKQSMNEEEKIVAASILKNSLRKKIAEKN